MADLRALDRSPWTGHRALLGHVPRPWPAAAADARILGAGPFVEAVLREEPAAPPEAAAA